MTGPATYGQLTELACRQLAEWSTRLATERLPTGAGMTAIGQYRAVLAALDRHAHQVTGQARHPLIDELDEPVTRPTRALRVFLDTLTRTATESGIHPGPHPEVAAARTWNAASDLLATHFTSSGEPRSPDAVHLDRPGGQAAALQRVAAAVTVLQAAVPTLRLRAAQAGVAWARVETLLPEQRDLMVAARRAAGAPVPAGWDGVTVARPGVPVDGRLGELTGRVRRLRHWAWRLATQPAPGVRTLTDFATTAVIVHRAAADLPGAGQPLTQRARDAATAWAGVRDGLHHLRTASPGISTVRADAHALQHLALELGAGIDCPDRHAIAVTSAVLNAFTDIAGWNAATVTQLASRRGLLLRGRYMTGSDITDHPDLAAAKLSDCLAPIPPGYLDRLNDAYAAAAAGRSPARPVTVRPTPHHTRAHGPGRSAPGLG